METPTKDLDGVYNAAELRAIADGLEARAKRGGWECGDILEYAGPGGERTRVLIIDHENSLNTHPKGPKAAVDATQRAAYTVKAINIHTWYTCVINPSMEWRKVAHLDPTLFTRCRDAEHRSF